MAQKWTDLNSTNASDRLKNVARYGSAHLSDGTLVFLEYDGTNVLLKHSGADHATVATIAASVTFNAGNTNDGQLALVVDNLDNIFVIGAGKGRAWTKGAGYSWTPQTEMTVTTLYNAQAAVWCNTGGGTNSKGHILLAGITTAPASSYAIVDAGVLLAGSGTPITNSGGSPTFLGSGAASTSLPDLAGDGFGATSGVSIFANTTTSVTVGSWAVNSSGALSTNSAIGSSLTTGSLTGAACSFLVRYASNAWAVIVNSSTSSGRYMVARYSSSAQLTALTDSGTPTNMPLVGNSSQCAAFADPVTANKIWILALDAVSGGNENVYRLGVSLASGVTFDGAATLADQLTTITTAGAHLSAVRQPRGSYVDWDTDPKISATNWATLGDYALFPSSRTHQMLV